MIRRNLRTALAALAAFVAVAALWLLIAWVGGVRLHTWAAGWLMVPALLTSAAAASAAAMASLSVPVVTLCAPRQNNDVILGREHWHIVDFPGDRDGHIRHDQPAFFDLSGAIHFCKRAGWDWQYREGDNPYAKERARV